MNVTFSQRTDGSKLVDIRYDLFGGTSSVAVAVSYDGGATYNAVASVTGAVGAGITAGTGKQIVWNAGVDFASGGSSNVKVRVTALLDGAGGTFAPIPAGTYQIGDNLDGLSDAPVTSVSLSGYYLSVNDTTKAQWDAVRTWGVNNGYTDLAAGEGKASDHPVQTVSWYAVVKWANAASEKEGLTPCYKVSGSVYRTGNSDAVVCDWSANGYRLPTEAEWEVAARGGLSGKRFPWGDTITHSQANYSSDSGYAYDVSPTRGFHPAYASGGTPYTSPVGSFAANGYGLRDMAGNVAQWCWDWYGGYSGGNDPRGSSAGSYRVLRGGEWGSVAFFARCALRDGFTPSFASHYNGFRLARGRSSGAGSWTESSGGVVDATAPVLSGLPASVSASATSASGASVTFGGASATDSVGTATVTYSPASGSTFPLGTTTVTVTATDSVGNTSTGTFTVTVGDTTAPVLTLPPNATADATGAGGATVSYAAATATDAVSATPVITYSQASGTVFPLGTTTVTVTAKDAADNTSTGTFTVTVGDTTAPVLTLPSNATADATGAGGATVSYAAATATDAVSASPAITYSQASGTVFPLGTTTVTVTAKDAADNTSTGTFTVTVSDTTAPVLTLPSNVTAEATGAGGATVNYAAATAADAVSATPAITYSQASGTVFPLGTTTVTVTAKDAANNTSTGTFTVTVSGQAPTLAAQPAGGTVTEGNPVEFSVTAAGTGPLSYQWKKGGADIAGATEAVYRIASATKADAGGYTVTVSNALGSVTSEPATLAVLKAARVTFDRAVYLQTKGSGETVVPVTVRRVVGTAEAVSVEVAASSDTLPEAAYALPGRPTVVRWTAGESGDKTVNVVLRAGVGIAPGGENIRLRLLNPTGADLGDIGEATVALTHRAPGVLGFETGTLERVKPETGDLTVAVAVRRTQGNTGAVSVRVEGGTAPVVLEWADGDAEPKSFPVVIPASTAVPSGGRSLVFRLRNPSGGAELGGLSTATLVVLPAGAPGSVGFAAPVFVGAKAASGETVLPVSVVRTRGGNGAVSVRVETAGGTAVAGTDYALPEGPVVLSWADDELGAKSFPIRILAGAQLGASGKTIVLRLAAPTGGLSVGAPGGATVRLTEGDTPGPVVAVEAPGANARVFGKSVVVRGTAKDISGVNRVTVALNGGDPVEAALTPAGDGNTWGWMVTVWPEQGVNTARVLAYDGRGNASAETVRRFTFGYTRPELAGAYDGLLEPGLTPEERAAQPALAAVFNGTRGRGLLSATVSAAGAVTGRLSAGGTEQVFKGVLKRDGTVLFNGVAEKWALKRTEGRVVTELGELVLRVREGEPTVLVGELKAPGGAVVLAGVEAEKQVYSAAKVLPAGMRRVPETVFSRAYENGRYTALFEPVVDEGTDTNGGLARGAFPQGVGSTRMTVSDSGLVRMVGRLADGAAVSYANRLSPTLGWPVYVPLYKGRGYVTGRVQFDAAAADSDAACEAMEWVRPAGLPAPYAAGWPEGIAVGFAASKYAAPARPTAAAPSPANPYTVFGPALPVNAAPDFATLTVSLSGGGLEGGAVQSATVTRSNVLKLAGAVSGGSPFAGFQWTFSPGDGGFGGAFLHPVTGKRVSFSGVTFQKTRRAVGSFVYLPTPPEGASVGAVEAVLP
jgi:formylglycine-generating enzyme required for sulfatase activity